MPQKRSLAAKEAVPIIRIVEVEAPTIGADLVPDLLREINDRQFGAITEVLLEAKFKAEAMLRNDSIYDSPGKVAFYSGWRAYSDYIISSFETLRSQQLESQAELRPGPDD